MFGIRKVSAMLLCIASCAPVAAWAAHPLDADDTGTQGKGKFQLEVTGEYGTEKETIAGITTRSTAGQMNATVTAGVAEAVDVFVDVPHQWNRAKEDGVVIGSERGFSDVSVGAKWRFFEKDGLSFAVKPAVSLGNGDENKGLGTGKTGYSAFFIAAKEMEPVAVFANIGYIRNNNKFDEVKDLWHVSVACTYEVVKSLKLGANIGMEKNADKAADKDPAFGILAAIYGITENLDVDFGVKKGLNDAETDLTLLAGVTLRF